MAEEDLLELGQVERAASWQVPELLKRFKHHLDLQGVPTTPNEPHKFVNPLSEYQTHCMWCAKDVTTPQELENPLNGKVFISQRLL